MSCTYIQRKDILKILVIFRLFTNLLRTNIYIYIDIYIYIYIIYTCTYIFNIYIYIIYIERDIDIYIEICNIESIFEQKHPSEKVIIVEEALNGIDIDDIGSLEDLPNLCSSIRNVRIIKQSLMVESLSKISTKRRLQTFYNRTNVHSVKGFVG